MIPIRRGREPDELADVRDKQLRKLRGLGREPLSDDIKGYDVVKGTLVRLQHHKCAWCEGPYREGPHDDVDHYRPKARANRSPGCTDTHGYWWLAFTWSNLLFSCATCNRSSKNDKFPLENGSIALKPEEDLSNREVPLLIDPANSKIHPATHIEFRWDEVSENCHAQPRNHSKIGYWTSGPRSPAYDCNPVIDLNRATLRELRSRHMKNDILPKVKKLIKILEEAPWTHAHLAPLKRVMADDARCHAMSIFFELRGMLAAHYPYVAATRDVLEQLIPNTLLKTLGQQWPRPEDLPLQ